MKPAVDAVDVLVVGAGPTGLTLASKVAACGATVSIVDDKAGPVAQSCALAIRPRTLEVLRGHVAGRPVEEGSRTVGSWHSWTWSPERRYR